MRIAPNLPLTPENAKTVISKLQDQGETPITVVVWPPYEVAARRIFESKMVGAEDGTMVNNDLFSLGIAVMVDAQSSALCGWIMVVR